MEKRVDPRDWKAAATVAKNVEIIDIYCDNASFSNDLNTRPTILDPNKVKLVAELKEFAFDQKSMILSNATLLTMNYTEKQRGRKLTISAIFSSRYKICSNPPPKELQEFFFKPFSEINTLYHIWPYWREFVHSAMCRMGLPQWAVPVVLIKPEESKDADPSNAVAKAQPAARRKA